MKIIIENSADLASVDHTNGIITVNQHFQYLPKSVQKFIINHEIGHFKLRSISEIDADNYAIKKIKNKKEFAQVANWITENLDYYNNSEYDRMLNVTRQGLKFNNSEEAQKEYEAMKENSVFIKKSNYRLFGIGTPSPAQMEKDRYKATYGGDWKDQLNRDKQFADDAAFSAQIGGLDSTTIYIIVALIIGFGIFAFYKYL